MTPDRGEPRWVDRLVVEAVHLDLVREHGGLPGLRDEHALEAALARPRQWLAYRPTADLAAGELDEDRLVEGLRSRTADAGEASG